MAIARQNQAPAGSSADGPASAPRVVRVSVLGAESTGKTTLCRDVAGELGIPFVAEVGRHYCEAMADARRYAWSRVDFEDIARLQNRFEDDAAAWAGELVLSDTNSFVTAVFAEVYLGEPPWHELEQLWKGRHYDLFLLTDPHTPFQHDDTTGLRNEATRTFMHERCLAYAAEVATPMVQVEGSRDDRRRKAIASIRKLNVGVG